MTMTVCGHIHNGTIVLDEPVPYQEGTEVNLDIVPRKRPKEIHPDLEKLVGIMPPDIDVKEEYYSDMMKKHS